MEKKIDKQHALSQLMAMCSKCEKCTDDVKQKLNDWDISATETAEIIDILQKEQFINDERYAAFYVRDKFRFNKWGRIKISYMLKSKNISPQLIKKSLDEISEKDYTETLGTLLREKSKSIKTDDEYERKSKLIRFAQSRGFEFEVIEKVMSAFKKQD